MKPRLTHTNLLILHHLLAHGRADDATITRATGVKSGSLYPIMKRFEEAGWLSSEGEDGDARVLGRPLRKFYGLTETGRGEIRLAISRITSNRS